MLEILINSSFVSGSPSSYNKIAKIHYDIRVTMEKEIKVMFNNAGEHSKAKHIIGVKYFKN